MTSVEDRAKWRASAQRMLGDIMYVNDPIRLILLDEIEDLSRALTTALDGWESLTTLQPGGAPHMSVTIADLRKLLPARSTHNAGPYR